MATMYYEQDADRSVLQDRPVAVLGYGSQGHAHALNLKDSGFDVRVGLRDGSPSWEKAEAAGLRVLETSKAAAFSQEGDPSRSPTRTSRSEEHTSELQSQSNLVCRLLLEKKKRN